MSARPLVVHDPSTGAVLAELAAATAVELDRVLAAALATPGEWRLDEPARRHALGRCADVLDAHVEELAGLVTAEQGKPLRDARREVAGSVRLLRYYAGLDVPAEVTSLDGARVTVLRRPLGVVAAITPWNFPLHLATMKIAPALRADNSVVLKPSPFTPLATMRMAELLTPVLPDGALSVLVGGDQLGKWLVTHPVPRKITFTGSTEAGRHVAAAAAKSLKRVTLELGGNDPAILLDDLDPATVARRVFWGAFANSGQVCAAIKRVYVPRSRHDAAVAALADCARSVVVGDGRAAATRLGPLTTPPQLRRVAALVASAVADGASAVTGGRRGKGYGLFYEPTIVTGAAHGMALVDEEQFGPALPVLAYDTLDEAVHAANATEYGLSASVWSGDADRAAAVATRIEAGTVWVNEHLVVAPEQPVAGAKCSGIGVENGPRGLHEFEQVQVLRVRGTVRGEPRWS